MPVEFVQSVDKLHHCFTDQQVADVYNCESSRDANGLILKHLTAKMVGVNDIITFCTQMEEISTSLKLDTVIKDLKRSCKFILYCIIISASNTNCSRYLVKLYHCVYVAY